MIELSKYIIFQLKEQSYGVGVQQVLSIEKMTEITEIPKASHFIKGVINFQGEVTPVIDLKERLELGHTTYTDSTRLLIVNIDGIKLGLVVDAANDVIDIDPTAVEQAPRLTGKIDDSFLKGVAKLEDELLLLLDLNYVLNIEELNEVKEVTHN